MTSTDQPKDGSKGTESLPSKHDGNTVTATVGGWGSPRPSTESGPVEIDRYLIIEPIGEGGMGTVYLAEQTRPIRRRVAIKLVRGVVRTEHALRRFESERQALARMNHPNIAQVYDAGSTKSGEPYFVMEYVPGETLNAYADHHQLPIADRLDLFLGILDGVQHAHQKGIIHRDLKPSNVIIATDQDRTPKIIDFGVAKAVDEPLDSADQLTRDRVVGTPAYMAPEQLQASGDVDTRSDVYSLGVTLYTLLTGVLPCDRRGGGTFMGAGTAITPEILRPSQRLDTVEAEELEQASVNRSADPGALKTAIRGDLDWITLKAMEHDPNRRYASINEFATDLRRHLAHEPVEARPPSAAYVAGRFMRRHRFALAAGSLVALALVAGIIGTTIQAQRANRETLVAQQVADFLVSVFEVSAPMRSKGDTVTARELLDRGSERLDAELKDQPLVRARLGYTMGTVYRQLGMLDKATSLTESALATTRKALGDRHLDVADGCYDLALVYCNQGRFDEAEPLLLEARDISSQAAGGTQSLANTLGLLGSLYTAQSRLEQAQASVESALPLFDEVGDDQGKAQALSVLAVIASVNEDYESSVRYSEECIEIARRTYEPGDPQLASYQQNLALTYGRLGRLEDREKLLAEVIASLETTLDETHPTVVRVRANLAYTWFDMGRSEKAEALLRRSIDDMEATLGVNHLDTMIALYNLGYYICDVGREDEALELLNTSVELFETNFGPDHPRTTTTLGKLAGCLNHVGREAEATAIEARIQAQSRE